MLRSLLLAAALAFAGTVQAAGIGYLGPAGSWTHEACADLYGETELVPLSREVLFADFRAGKLDKVCIPVTTVAVGPTPYLDDVLALPDVRVIAEYPKPLSYSLLANPAARLADITEVIAHPVAFAAVKPWLDVHLPKARRTEALSNGEAARIVAESRAADRASMGPAIGEQIYGLKALAGEIEKGPHNVTRFWVLGRETPAPTGNDKTSLLVSTTDGRLADLLKAFADAGVRILDIYERPSGVTLDAHRYLVEVSGHAADKDLARFIAAHPEARVLGAYPRRY